MNSTGNEKQTVIEADPTGRYERTAELLGRGAYKEVYRAYDSELGVEVAWNQLAVGNLTEKTAQKILEEIRILQGLKCDYIIRFYHSWVASTGRQDGSFQVYFITELMTSGTIKSFIKKTKTPIRTRVIKNWAKQILSGLHYLHTLDPPIIHRDLKCDNIFINGNNGQAKIGDFGLAIIKRRERECLSTVIGTPEFMAPELYDEHYDEKIDIYSFGMCILELVTRDYPYSECENAAQIYRKVTKGVKPASLYQIEDKEVRDFIELCIQSDHRKRPSADELMHHSFVSLDSPAKEAEELPNMPTASTLSSPITAEHVATDSSRVRDMAGKDAFSCNVQITQYEYPTVEIDMVIACGLMACSGVTKSRQVKFSLNVETETPQQIAFEMVKHDLVPEECMTLIEDEIGSAISDFFKGKLSPNGKEAESGYEPDYEPSPCKSESPTRGKTETPVPRKFASKLQLEHLDRNDFVGGTFKPYPRKESFSEPDLPIQTVAKKLPCKEFPSDSDISCKHDSVDWMTVKNLICTEQERKETKNKRSSIAANFKENSGLVEPEIPPRSTTPPLANSAFPAGYPENSLTPFKDLSDSPTPYQDRNSRTLSFLETEFCNAFSSNFFNPTPNNQPATSNGHLSTKNKSSDLLPLNFSSEIPNTSIDPIEFLQHKELEEFVISTASSVGSSSSSNGASSITSPTTQLSNGHFYRDLMTSENDLFSAASITKNGTKTNGILNGVLLSEHAATVSNDSFHVAADATQNGISLDLNQSLIDLDDSGSSLLPPLLVISSSKCKSSIDLLCTDDIPDDSASPVNGTAAKCELQVKKLNGLDTKEQPKSPLSLLDIK